MYQDTDFVSNLRHVATQGDLIHSRGLKAVEVTAFTHLFNAESFEGYRFEDLVILHPARNLRVRYQWAEACYFWLGLKDDTLFKFSKTAGSMMSADSEYGGRIRTGLAGRRSGLGPNVDQLKAVIDRLESDPDTRQAVISIYHAGDLLFDNDVPCTLSIQFLLRDGELNAICTMRSNDILLGHTLDVFNVRLWQTLLSKILNVHVGYLVWQVGSMHLYIDEKSQDTA
jgi:thymidylate synthase